MSSATSVLSPAASWERYKKYFCSCPGLGLSLDISRMNFGEEFVHRMAGPMEKAFSAMDQLEAGAMANPDEKRMVGHYWLRDATRAPKPEIRAEIEKALAAVKAFAADVHSGKIAGPGGRKLFPQQHSESRGTGTVRFQNVLVVGIGGSALGPQFVSDALTSSADKTRVFFFDNTDPDGMDRALDQIAMTGDALGLERTLTVVISKSGGTKETRNGMLAAAAAYQRAGLEFAKHAVAVTGEGSELDKVAVKDGWLARFPMWDWVGGRTSELSAVGLLPAALQGIDIDAMLAGARDTDQASRLFDTMHNPAALLALMWYHAGDGRGKKDMVVLPYKDRLLYFSRYLQQLVMESLGKERDLTGKIVHQGIAVYGNKGSTDQHAYVQQLREGVNNFFVTFIEVLKDRSALAPGGQTSALMVEPDVTSGDYLHGFFQGTRSALTENGRENLTITIDEVSPRTIGVLIALFERAVGLYAQLIGINAYHQPGVEAGKKAATAVISLQSKILAHLRSGKSGTADQIAAAIGTDQVETVYMTLGHLAANPEHRIAGEGSEPVQRIFRSQ
ncbi:MAG TPA: glucose-6-phosphate isomerase [Phycisphaerae bacterium]|nr:glucose-6-phosphate isomerase [Phycisphaerae bacterium]